MHSANGVILYGVSSPLIVDYEETLRRLNADVIAAVSVGGPVRILSRKKMISAEDARGRFEDAPFIPCAFAPQNRRSLWVSAVDLGLTLGPALVDPNAVIASTSKVAAGCYLNAGAVVGGASVIDQCVVVNRNASIGHHCMVSEFVSIGPGVTIASNVNIGKGAVIGAGATVLPDVRIGDFAVVAGGSVVRRNVPAETLVSGNPARASRLKPEQTKVWRNDQE